MQTWDRNHLVGKFSPIGVCECQHCLHRREAGTWHHSRAVRTADPACTKAYVATPVSTVDNLETKRLRNSHSDSIHGVSNTPHRIVRCENLRLETQLLPRFEVTWPIFQAGSSTRGPWLANAYCYIFNAFGLRNTYSAFHARSRLESILILMSIRRSATLCLWMMGTVPPRVSFFENSSAAVKAARIMLTEKAPTIAAEAVKDCSTRVAAASPAARTFSSGTWKFVHLLCGPDVAGCPINSGSSKISYALASLSAMMSRVTSKIMIAWEGSANSPSVCLQTTHWRSAPFPSQPPLFVVHT